LRNFGERLFSSVQLKDFKESYGILKILERLRREAEVSSEPKTTSEIPEG
jgi:hypothetical protein